jgi:hypothetical protein
VIALDTNVLVYAYRPDATLHESAVRTTARLAAAPTAWAIPWACLHEFYSVVTGRRGFDPPATSAEALDQIDAWLEAPTLRVLGEATSHLQTLADLIRNGDCRGPMIFDARIAAICLDHGVSELITMDRDFTRFPALRTRSLLA